MPTNIPDFTLTNTTPTSRRNIIRFILPGLIIENFTGAAALRAFRANGLGINTKAFYNMWNKTLGIEKDAQTVKFVGKRNRPDKDGFAIADWEMKSDYVFYGDYKELDITTGKTTIKSFSISVNDYGTREEIEAALFDALVSDYDDPNLFIYGMSLRKAFRRA